LKDYPLALCNDGSAAMFSIRPGFGAAKNRWMIFLDGGASCYDQASCTERASETPDLISSNGYISNDFAINFWCRQPEPHA